MTLDDIDREVLTLDELAAVLGCSGKMALTLMYQGHIRFAKIGRSYKIPKSAVREFLDSMATV